MAQDDLSAAELQKQLNDYAAAIRSEFEAATKEAPENAEEAAKDYFRKNLSQALAQVVWLASNADSETVRLNASKFIINEALDEAKGDGDPIKQLLKELSLTAESND